MIGAVAAFLLATSTNLPAHVGASDLPQLFIGACLDGEARLPAGSADATSFAALPRELRKSLGHATLGHVWRLNGASDAFLYALDDAPAPNSTPRICGVASEQMNYRAAADAVERRVTGAVYPKTTGSIRWLDPQGGYIAIVTTVGKFKVLQVNWLTNAQRATAIRNYRPIMPRR